jgi:hypothetical protein
MQVNVAQIKELITAYIPNLIGAIAILILGWLISLLVTAIVRAGLRHTTLDNRLARWIMGEEAAKKIEVEEGIAKGIFYLLMLFVLVAFFQALGLTLITEPINRFLTKLFQFIPQLLGALILLIIAWFVAGTLRLIISKLLSTSKFDEIVGEKVGREEKKPIPLTKTIADTVYWLVFLLFLPAILSTLALEGLLEPIREMVNRILTFLPNIFAAGLILGAGWFVARIIQRIVTNLLTAIGTDRLGEQVGIGTVLGTERLSGLLGFIVYILILIPVLIASLNALKLEAVTKPASNMLNMILQAIPSIFAAALLLTISYIIGRLVANLIATLLANAGFNKIMVWLGIGEESSEGTKTPSNILGYLVLVIIMLLAIIEVFQILGFGAAADLISQFIIFISHVILGLIIFGIGLYLANLASKTIQASSTTQANLLALAARITILIFAGAMGLRQMGLANEIINLAFGLLLGAIAIAIAIAFGLGGQKIAAQELDEWIKSLRSKSKKSQRN